MSTPIMTRYTNLKTEGPRLLALVNERTGANVLSHLNARTPQRILQNTGFMGKVRHYAYLLA